jgi:hypothetical protein
MYKPLVAAVLVCTSVATARADVVEPTLDQPAVTEPPAPPAQPPPAQALDADQMVVTPPSSYTPLPPTRETARDDDGPPPLSGGRLLGEAAVGSLFAVGGGIGGAYMGFALETSGDCGGEFCGLGGAILGGVAGLAFVTPIGVYMVGSSGDQTGSLGATIGGSVVGTLVGVAAAAGGEDEDLAVVCLIAGPVLGSMAGFNLTRKYVPGHKAHSWAPVANVSHGKTSFGVVGRF